MMSERTGSIRPMGSLRTTEGKAVVRMEDRFQTDVDDMWSAITEPERLARWIAQVDGDLRLGGVFRASFTSGWEGSRAGGPVRTPSAAAAHHVPGLGRADRHRGRTRP